MKEIYLYETVFPDYRLGLFEGLKETYGDAIVLACGDVSFSPTLRTAPAAEQIAVRLVNRFLLGRRLLWQQGVLHAALKAPLVIAEFSVRCPSTWLLLFLRRCLGRPTILWGHAAGSRRVSSLIRRAMFACCNGFVAYMPREQRKLRLEFPGLPVWVAPNSFMWRRECFPLDRGPVRDVIYVGRLVGHKKVALLLDGFCRAVEQGWIPAEARLRLVGAGPDQPQLAALAQELRIGERVDFVGHVSAIDPLREFYATALVAVSPGCVGLAATQAFSFGVPIVVADDEPHGPELEICRPQENTVFFTANDPEALARRLGEVFAEQRAWMARRERISADLRQNYTFDSMLASFRSLIEAFRGQKTTVL